MLTYIFYDNLVGIVNVSINRKRTVTTRLLITFFFRESINVIIKSLTCLSLKKLLPAGVITNLLLLCSWCFFITDKLRLRHSRILLAFYNTQNHITFWTCED